MGGCLFIVPAGDRVALAAHDWAAELRCEVRGGGIAADIVAKKRDRRRAAVADRRKGRSVSIARLIETSAPSTVPPPNTLPLKLARARAVPLAAQDVELRPEIERRRNFTLTPRAPGLRQRRA